MTAKATREIAPIEAKSLMPHGYLKQIQQLHQDRAGKAYSLSTIQYAVVNARTTHPIWPIVLELAQAEKKRRDKEAKLNAQYLKSLQA